MLKRTRNVSPVEEPTKGRKRAHEDEETTVEENVDPGRLGNFIKNPRMIELLQNNGVKCLFPIQYSTFNLILKGNDIRAKDRTGSGKTLAFALPVIEKLRNEKRLGGKNPGFLVVLPTR
jgi:superfamily II DNA/RNA helicase